MNQSYSFNYIFNLQQVLLHVNFPLYSHNNAMRQNDCDKHAVCMNEYKKNVNRYIRFTY